MPYSDDHKRQTRAKIVESARVLFNRHGFDGVTIDALMEAAGLTRGGFYNHFRSKEALYSEAVSSFLMGRGAEWRADSGVVPGCPGPDMTRNMIHGYLSPAHLEDIDGQCPMIALPSDVARASPAVRESYQVLLQSMVGLFEAGLEPKGGETRQQALSLAALCIGGMILARTLPDSDLANEVRLAAMQSADRMI